MAERNIVKNFNNFRGRDVRSSDLVRNADYAIEFENALVVKEDSCVKRQGFKIRGNNAQYNGLYTYRYADSSTGSTIEELISLSDSLYRYKEGSFTITYSGTSTNVIVSLTLDVETQTFKFVLSEDDEVIVTIDIGTGLEDTPVTLADLGDSIYSQSSGLFDTSYSIADAELPAAFLPITVAGNLSTSSYEMLLRNWEKMSTLVTSVFADYHANRGNDEWEIASTVNMNNVLYIATGYEYLHKYDGQNVYRAGLPFPETVPSIATSGTGITDTSIKYIYLYKQIDNRGNIAYSIESDPSNALSPSNQGISITLGTVEHDAGFNTGAALVDGTQTGVNTITVDECNTLKVGDTAYFYDGVSSSYVERLVTARTNTTITVAGNAINVTDGDVISNNLRIVVYRNTAGGSLYYKVVEIPNNPFVPTQAYLDTLATASLGSQYLPPTQIRDILEIKPRYLAVHQNLLIAAGAANAANNWYYSNNDNPEGFDAEINVEQIKSTFGGGIKGLGSDQEHLIIGTEKALFVVTGDIGGGTARQEKVSQRGLGFASHNSIVDIGDRIIFLSTTGFWAIQGGFNIEEIGAPVNPDFLNVLGFSEDEKPRLKRAVATYYEETNEYICFVPAETGSGTNKYVNENSVTHTYDTFHQAWGTWTGLNLAGGVTVFENNIFFQDKRFDSVLSVSGNLWERQNSAQVDDYNDHHLPIAFKLGTQWMDAGEPSVFKVFLWLKIYNLFRTRIPAPFTFSISVEKDYNKGVPWSSFDIVMGGISSLLGWGYFPWGITEWGSPQVKTGKKKLRSGKAESLRYVITNSVGSEKTSISAWETVVTLPYAVNIKD